MPSIRVLPLLAVFPLMALAFAQQSTRSPDAAMRGYSAGQALEQMGWENKFRAIPRTDLLREYMGFLASEPHHLGSPKGRANAEWMRDKFVSWGLDAEIEEFKVLFPIPKERVVELIEPEKYAASLREPSLVEDPDTSDAGQLPTYNVFSSDGDVTAQLVYVNYGLPQDYEFLRKSGIDVRGKIVLARYGASWRGIKPKLAHENGAVGCLIYSDPKEDGYYQGLPYPEGPYRPEHGVQRGSVVDMPLHPGDPLTPGVGSTAEARRLSLQEAATPTKIPVLPISYADALPLLRNLRGTIAPDPWRGALPVTYHIGPGPAVVHLKLSFSWDLHSAYDVIARIPGSVFPDEWVIQGNHHDGWVNGASDPTSGMVAVLEEGRAFGELLKQGWRPKRTIILAAWDGEEEGLLGSTEWAEAHAQELMEKCVAYFNTDSNGVGWLEVSGSHSLERFIHEVARDIADPLTGKSVYDSLRDRMAEQAQGENRSKEIRARADLPIAAVGSGSDYTVFIDHLGISILSLGFGGAGGGGVYHSIYDTVAWFNRFSDSTFVYGRTLAQTAGTCLMRMADAPLLPFEFTNLAETVGQYAAELEQMSAEHGKVDLAPLKQAQQTLSSRAAAYEKALAQAGAAVFARDASQLRALNKLLYQSERTLTDAGGLPIRPWYKHQLYAPGFYTGYGVKTVPYVREALERKEWELATTGAGVVRRRLLALSDQIDAATKLLR